MTENDLKLLYGTESSRKKQMLHRLSGIPSGQSWANESSAFGANIDIKEFYNQTYAPYKIYYCKMKDTDCRSYWDTELTLNGICIVLRPFSLINGIRKQFGNNTKIDLGKMTLILA